MNKSSPNAPGYVAWQEARQERIASLRLRLEDILPSAGPYVLEIGCGHGHFLAAYAETHPQTCCVGVDLVTRRVEKGRQKGSKRGLSQLHFIKAEANECLEAWPQRARLERVFILFPDPWPKKRHAKNRILQEAFLQRLALLCRPGTRLHFRTDDTANFEWGRHIIATTAGWVEDPEERWPFENPSFFQNLFSSYHSLTARFEGA